MSTTTQQPAPLARPEAVPSKLDALAQGVALTWLDDILKPNECKPVTLSEIVAKIRSRDLEAQTKEIRRLSAEKLDVAAYQLKVQLPVAIPAGQFKSARNLGLVSHSGLMVVDFDKIPTDKLERFRAILAADPHAAFLFVSSSGCGLKWFVSVEATDGASHEKCFDSMCGYVW